MIGKPVLFITFLNNPKLILFCTVKLFHTLQCIPNNSIKYQLFVYPHLNDQTVLFLRIQFSINFMLAFT